MPKKSQIKSDPKNKSKQQKSKTIIRSFRLSPETLKIFDSLLQKVNEISSINIYKQDLLNLIILFSNDTCDRDPNILLEYIKKNHSPIIINQGN